MRVFWIAAAGAALAGPAAAQSLNDAGRMLQQYLPGQQQQQQPQGQSDRDRAIYEQGRRDAQQRGSGGDDRRRADDRPRYNQDQDRRRGDPDRSYDDDRAPPRQSLSPSGQYQRPYDNR